MKTRMMILTLTGIWITTPALAAQEAKGGKAVLCAGKAPVILDYYNAALPTVTNPSPAMDLEKLTLGQARSLIEKRIQAVSPFLYTQYLRTVGELGRIESWGIADLKDVTDTNEIYILPKDCSFAQAAVRQNRSVFLDTTMARALSPGQFAVLEAHEILYRIGEVEKGLQTSEKVREFAKYLLLTEFQRAPALSTAESIGSHNYASQAVLAQLPKGTNSRISYVADTAGDCVIRFQTNEAYPNPRSKNQKDAEFFDLSTGCLGSSSIYTASATFSCSLESSRCISRTVWGTFVFDQFSADASQFSVIQLELGSAAKPVIFRLQQ